MKSIREIKNLSGKRVLLRADFNVEPFHKDEGRILGTLPTIKYLQKKGAKIILLTHLETNDGKIPSLISLSENLRKYFFKNLVFIPLHSGAKVKTAISHLRSGGILLLENLRKDPREKSSNLRGMASFARELASLGDLFVNEAFSNSHRAHASIVVLPRLLPSFAGFLLEEEIRKLSIVFRPPRPFLAILGGAKIETKLPLLKILNKKADAVIVGGALVEAFMKSRSKKNDNLILPERVAVMRNRRASLIHISKIKIGEKIYDIDLNSVYGLKELSAKARLIVWNGPLGYIEKGFVKSTRDMGSLLKKASGKIIIGGGDTAECLPKKLPKNIFVSTGGGAMLEYLVHKTLPGIKALR